MALSFFQPSLDAVAAEAPQVPPATAELLCYNIYTKCLMLHKMHEIKLLPIKQYSCMYVNRCTVYYTYYAKCVHSDIINK